MAVTHIESRCVVDDEGCARNLASAVARNLPFIEEQPARTERLAIVASGPSVSAHLDEIKSFDHIWAVNGAYGYLIDQGIICDGFVGVDPLPSLAGYFDNAHERTTFYMSAHCDPSTFDVLKGFKVQLWTPEVDAATPKLKRISGGTSAITRAPFVARELGFRDITLFGVDSSFNGSRYCYRDGDYPEDSKAPVMRVFCNGEGPFLTELCLVKQVSQLGVMAMYQTWGVKFQIKCGGLLDAYLRSPLETEDGGVYAG